MITSRDRQCKCTPVRVAPLRADTRVGECTCTIHYRPAVALARTCFASFLHCRCIAAAFARVLS